MPVYCSRKACISMFTLLFLSNNTWRSLFYSIVLLLQGSEWNASNLEELKENGCVNNCVNIFGHLLKHFDVQYIHGVLLTYFNLFPFSFIQSWVYFEHYKRNRQLFPRDISLSQHQVCVPLYKCIISWMFVQFLDFIEFCLQTLCATLADHTMQH